MIRIWDLGGLKSQLCYLEPSNFLTEARFLHLKKQWDDDKPFQDNSSTKQCMACGINLTNAANSLLQPPREERIARSTESNVVLCLKSLSFVDLF